VNQVIHNVYRVHGPRNIGTFLKISLHHFDIIPPRHRVESVRFPGQNTDRVAFLQEFGNKATTHVSRRTGDQDLHADRL